MSAIWSASSMVTIATLSSLTARRSMRSMRRPGVATTIPAPLARLSICCFIDDPPYTATMGRRRTAASGARTSVTWLASSRVGTSTSPVGRDPSVGFSIWTMGSPKARVLPEPVRARPHTSLPARMSGMAMRWMAKGWPIPPCSSRVSRSWATPNAAKPLSVMRSAPVRRGKKNAVSLGER